MKPSDREIVRVQGRYCGEGKSWFPGMDLSMVWLEWILTKEVKYLSCIKKKTFTTDK